MFGFVGRIQLVLPNIWISVQNGLSQKLSSSNSVLRLCIVGSLLTINRSSTQVHMNVNCVHYLLINRHGSFFACSYPRFSNSSSTVCRHKLPAVNGSI